MVPFHVETRFRNASVETLHPLASRERNNGRSYESVNYLASCSTGYKSTEDRSARCLQCIDDASNAIDARNGITSSSRRRVSASFAKKGREITVVNFQTRVLQERWKISDSQNQPEKSRGKENAFGDADVSFHLTKIGD